METHLTGLTSFFPWNFIIALFLAFTFAVIGIAIFRHATTKKEDEPTPTASYPLLDKWKTFFAQFGFFPTNSFSKSFVYALNIMSSFIGGKGFRYQLPWIVMMGAKDSGKSTVLQAIDLDRPIGRPHFSDEEGNKPLCDWWFYDHGIVLDLSGKIVVNPSQATSDEDNWQLFLNLLAHHRSKRPLDGVVLTIPASEIIGKTALSHDDIMIRAEYLYSKLWNLQRVTGIRVPVYLMITKCDIVPGFTSFCKSLPTHNKYDIFGWSNDEAIDAIYTADWIDIAFSSINQSLYRVQEEIYANGDKVDGHNGVFLFPISLNALKGGIQTYVNHLFKESSYHESFFLRGIYFVGDSHLETPSPHLKSSATLPLSFQGEGGATRKNIYFADNVFENKVFREIGLARPVSRVLLGNTRTMRIAKIGVTIAVVLGTLGLLRANERLQEARLNLTPALTQVENTLAEIRGQSEESETGRVLFENQATVLLNMMTQISVNRLSSLFIPASWFDSLDQKIRYVMGLAYDQVILRAMARELDNMARRITSLSSPISVAEVPVDGIDPLKTLEFYQLRNYTGAIHKLEDIATRFSRFYGSTSLKDVGEVIKYLFNYEMPQSFYENNDYYIDALRKTNITSFDFSRYQEMATTKLQKLFDAFEVAAFDPTRMIPGFGQLKTSLYNFSGAHNYAVNDIHLLREVFLSLRETIASIINPGLNWLDEDHFDPSLEYEKVKNIIEVSQFFNRLAAQALLTEINQNFINFRKQLAEYKHPLFNGQTLFKQENGLAVSLPSSGALNLQKNLESFFNEPFMAPTTEKTIITSIPTGSSLFWDTLRLQEAANLVSVYNNFMNSDFYSLPKTLQPLLQKVAREGLTQNLVSLIVDAEIFNSEIVVESRLAPEDGLLPQVQNYRAAAPYLEQLLITLKTNSPSAAFSALKNVVTSQSYSLLEKLDHILTNEEPYAIKLNSFNWWDGKDMAALEAFSVLNLNELKHYLELQRDRINYLAREFAGPLTALLEKINMEGMPGNLPLLGKWDSIIHELSEYDRKVPGNGLVELENYVMYPLNEVTIATCNKYTNMYNALSAVEDYFMNTLIHIQQKLHERCIALSSIVSMDYYANLSQFFNTNLAGKFPFVEIVDSRTPDANPEDIRTFFEMMDAQATSIKNTLKEAGGAQGKKAFTFIEQMEQVRHFFGGYLEPDSPIPNPAFTFDVAFRVNKEKECYANEILDWDLSTHDATITMRSPSRVGYWEAGDPLKVTFRWALNSPLQPTTTEGLSNYDVQGGNAVFYYEGIWALLRLLKQHHATVANFGSLRDEDPITLRFDIPLANVLPPVCTKDPLMATVFIRLKVSPISSTPPKKTKGEATKASQEKMQMGKPVNLPYFPSIAPCLNNVGGRL